MRKRYLRRILAVILSMLMIIGTVPTSVFAEGATESAENEEGTEDAQTEESVSDETENLENEVRDEITEDKEENETQEESEEELSNEETADLLYSSGEHTRDDAVKWAYAQGGKYLDYDKAYGAQCVDLIKYYYAYFGKASYARGNGCDYVSNALPAGWTRIKNTADFVPQPGDIAVWGTELSKYGHVAIILSANVHSFVSMDQNWPSGSACKQVTHTYSKFWGVIRPNFLSVANNPIGQADSAGGGALTVSGAGWAFDADDLSAALEIHVYLDSTFVGKTIANLSRDDVNKAYGCGPNHGYGFEIKVGKEFVGKHVLNIYAINVGGGDNTLLRSLEVDIADANNPIGQADSAGGGALSVGGAGWAFDQDDLGAALEIHIYLDDKMIGKTVANLERDDVNKTYGCGPNHGYGFDIKVGKEFVGKHVLNIYAINVGGGDNTLLRSLEVDIANANNPIGQADSIGGGTYSVGSAGWAFDQDDFAAALEIHAYLDDRMIGKTIANLERDDVNKAYGCGPNHGYAFDIKVGKEFVGKHVLNIYAISVGGGDDTLLRSEEVDIKEDTKGPEISDCTVSNITTDGYTVTCKVIDESGVDRVQFPTWTEYNGQDDLSGDWSTNSAFSGTRNGDVFSYRVKTSDHNNEKGVYITHIYAYDKYGNANVKKIDNVTILETLKEFTLSYDANGGSQAPEKEQGTEVTISTKKPKREGYTFLGWAKKANAEKAEYQSGDKYVLDEDTTLYAVWEKAITGTCGEKLIWSLSQDGVLTISGTGTMTNYTYKSQMPWYQYINQIKNIVIKEGVTSIGDYAFYGISNLTKVTIPKGITAVGEYAFKNCTALNDIQLPTTLKKLGESAFFGCSALREILIPEGLYTIWGYTFKNCTKLEKVTFPSTLVKIDEAAFYGCSSLKTLTIPDNVSIIGIYCFKNCTKLSSVQLSANIQQIREAVFYGTAITELKVPDKVTSIGAYAFKNCTKLKDVTFSKKLTKIDDSAFYACSGLTVLNLPDSLIDIKDYAFRKCTELKTINFSAGLKTVGESSFYGCEKLTELKLPEGVTDIKGYAFKGCVGVTTITLPTTLKAMGESAFYGCTGISKIEIPKNVNTVGAYAFSRCSKLSEVVFKGNAPIIGDYAFAKVTAKVSYPSGNTTWNKEKQQNYGGTLTWSQTK